LGNVIHAGRRVAAVGKALGRDVQDGFAAKIVSG
jgi:hypothetical protein